MRSTWLLIALALAAFGASLAGPFHFDDFSLFGDPAVASIDGWRLVADPVRTRPLTWLTFWVNWWTGGSSPSGYHAVNLALHAACVLLLWSVLRRMLPETAAFAGAALFAIHPIQTEAVSYVFARSTLLAALFCLLSLRAWTGGRRWIAVLWFVPALLSKEECVTFPLCLLLLSRDWSGWRQISVMLAGSLAAGLRAVWAASAVAGSGAGAAAGISPVDYASMQGLVILRYFRLIFLPWGYTVDPDIRVLGNDAVWLAWLALGGAVAFAWRRWDGRGWVRWLAGGLILLAASSSIFPAADLAADRRMYLPMIAFSAVLGLLAARIPLPVRVAIAVVLVAISVRYTLVWGSEDSLWREAVELAPRKVRPRRQLARTLDAPDAIQELQQARRFAPNDAGIAGDMGKYFMALHRPDLALREFGTQLAAAPRDPDAMANRAIALAAMGDKDGARTEFRRALAADACHFDALRGVRLLDGARPLPPACKFTADQRAALETAR